jgi:RNA polymerase sigma-70 factor (ECF subfamily)
VTFEKTDWAKIVELYDMLYRLKPSPIVALNRAVALGKALGPEEGLAELGKIADADKLKDYPFYPAAQGEFHLLAGRPAEAGECFERAMKLARSRSEKNFFERKLKALRTTEVEGKRDLEYAERPGSAGIPACYERR